MNHTHLDRLVRGDGPGKTIHLLAATASDAYDLARKASDLPAPRTVARVVRGTSCRTARALFAEFAAAWQFPPYFGANWDALDECLADLDWLPAAAHVLMVLDAPALLADEGPEAFRLFLDLVAGVAAERAAPGRKGGVHPAPFRVVLQAEPADASAFADRLEAAGVEFDRL